MRRKSEPGSATVRATVRASLGARAEQMTRAELESRVRQFIAAGRRAIAPPAGSRSEAAQQIDEAREALAHARRRLSQLSVEDSEPMVATDAWARHHRAIDEYGARLKRIKGVVGYAPSIKRVLGAETGEPCVLVLVERKLSPGQLRRHQRREIPKHVTDPVTGDRLPTDVVQVGRLKRQAFVGASIGPARKGRKGSVGVFGRDRGTGLLVALTAMHVSGLKEFSPSRRVAFTSPSFLDDRAAGPFGQLLDGTMTGVDAAMVSVVPPATAVQTVPRFGPLAGWRALAFPGDRGAVAKMLGAVSGFQSGLIIEPGVAAPAWGLDSALLVDIRSAKGDSGAAVFDNSGFALGLLAGEAEWLGNPIRVFSPLSLVLQRLNCDFI